MNETLVYVVDLSSCQAHWSSAGAMCLHFLRSATAPSQLAHPVGKSSVHLICITKWTWLICIRSSFLPSCGVLVSFPKQSLLAVYLQWNSNLVVSSLSGFSSLLSAFTEFRSIDEEAVPIHPHLPDPTSSFNALQLTYPVEESHGWWSRVLMVDILCFPFVFFLLSSCYVGSKQSTYHKTTSSKSGIETRRTRLFPRNDNKSASMTCCNSSITVCLDSDILPCTGRLASTYDNNEIGSLMDGEWLAG